MMKAIILLSGGLDSTVMLAKALSEGRKCHALSFDYGQRHKLELTAAAEIASYYGVPHTVIAIDPKSFAGSSLVSDLPIPQNRNSEEISQGGIPNTYVPARNTLFLAYALGQAEILLAEEIYFGANAQDILPYPDCRPAFIAAFQALIQVSTKQAIEGRPPKLITPLIAWTKKEIAACGRSLNAPLHLTLSCYRPVSLREPCGSCDACILRSQI